MNTFQFDHHRYMQSEEWKLKRASALTAAGHQCQQCGAQDRLHVHHLSYERFGNEQPEDLQVLCRLCHDAVHGRAYKVRSRATGYERVSSLKAYWEVALDPMSDEEDEDDALELFYTWGRRVTKEYPSGLLPIYWGVRCVASRIMETMPHQFWGPGPWPSDFLTHFYEPENCKTGEPLNWLSLPVCDKRWSRTCRDKGGFIQETTGWKPSVLQPYVFLPSLMAAVR